MIGWLLHDALPKVEYTAISTITGAIVLGCIIAPFRHVWKKLWRAADSLDPDTDSGVTKELHQLTRRVAVRPEPDSHDSHHLR